MRHLGERVMFVLLLFVIAVAFRVATGPCA